MIASREYVKDILTKIMNKVHTTLLKDLYYKSGDTISEFTYCSGCITSSGKQLIFRLNVPKSLKYVSSFTITQFTGNCRDEGYYIGSSAYVSGGTNLMTSLSSHSATKIDNRNLYISLYRSAAYTNGTNANNSAIFFDGSITIKIN